MKEGVEAAKALWVGGVRSLLAGKIKVGTSLFQVCCLSENPIFPEQASSAEGPDPCELAQNPRYRKGPDVCFDNNENVRHKHTCASVAGTELRGEIKQLKTFSLVSHVGWMLSDSVWFSSALLTACPPYSFSSSTYFLHYSSICHYFACMCCLFLSSPSCDLSTRRLYWRRRRRLLSGRMNPCAPSAEVLGWAASLPCCLWRWV